MKQLSFLRRIAAMLRRDRLADDLAEEIRHHIELRRDALVAAGMDPRDAEYEARRIFGNVARKREDSRETWGFRSLDALAQDVRFGARLLRRSPMFALVAVLSLSIGIGATSAVFSLADAMLFRKLPVESPDNLTLFQWRSGPRFPAPNYSGSSRGDATMNFGTSFSLATFDAFRADAARLARLVGFATFSGGVNLTIGQDSEVAAAQFVSGNYYSTLGVRPAAGRLLVDDDDRIDAPPAAVISHQYWVRRFAAAPGAIGSTIAVNRVPMTIVGVTPKGFHSTLPLGQSPAVSFPLALRQTIDARTQWRLPSTWWVLVMARREPGVTPEALGAVLDGVLKRSVAEGAPELAADELPRLELLPGARGVDYTRESSRTPLGMMASVVAIVLLIACANIANLLLVRGAARAREMALRAAIGASRRRLVRQLLTEGVLLAALGSVGGLVVANSVAAALLPALSDSTIDAFDIGTGWRVFTFTAVVAAICSALFGVAPALRAASGGIAAGLQESSRGATASRRRVSLTGMLVIVQVALSVVLVIVAGLLVHSVRNLERVDPGFDAANTLLFNVNPTRSGYDAPRTLALLEQLRERLSALPSVRSASFSHAALISGSAHVTVAFPLDTPAALQESFEERSRRHTWRLIVGDDFFTTMGIPMLRGRSFSREDSGDQHVAVVNRALAERLFGSTDVVGRRFKVSSRAYNAVVEIIGVCANAKYESLRADPPPTVYVGYRQAGAAAVTFAIRTTGEPVAVVPLAREVVRALDPNLPLTGIRTQEGQIRLALTRERLMAALATVLGFVAVFLAGIGLYGMLAYSVGRRVPEIGIRLALGAERRDVRWMVIRSAMLLAAVGVAVGVAAARAGTGVIQSLLFGLSPTDPLTFVGAALAMMGIAIAAASIPAWRAARVDPMIALRAE